MNSPGMAAEGYRDAEHQIRCLSALLHAKETRITHLESLVRYLELNPNVVDSHAQGRLQRAEERCVTQREQIASLKERVHNMDEALKRQIKYASGLKRELDNMTAVQAELAKQIADSERTEVMLRREIEQQMILMNEASAREEKLRYECARLEALAEEWHVKLEQTRTASAGSTPSATVESKGTPSLLSTAQTTPEDKLTMRGVEVAVNPFGGSMCSNANAAVSKSPILSPISHAVARRDINFSTPSIRETTPENALQGITVSDYSTGLTRNLNNLHISDLDTSCNIQCEQGSTPARMSRKSVTFNESPLSEKSDTSPLNEIPRTPYPLRISVYKDSNDDTKEGVEIAQSVAETDENMFLHEEHNAPSFHGLCGQCDENIHAFETQEKTNDQEDSQSIETTSKQSISSQSDCAASERETADHHNASSENRVENMERADTPAKTPCAENMNSPRSSQKSSIRAFTPLRTLERMLTKMDGDISNIHVMLHPSSTDCIPGKSETPSHVRTSTSRSATSQRRKSTFSFIGIDWDANSEDVTDHHSGNRPEDQTWNVANANEQHSTQQKINLDRDLRAEFGAITPLKDSPVPLEGSVESAVANFRSKDVIDQHIFNKNDNDLDIAEQTSLSESRNPSFGKICIMEHHTDIGKEDANSVNSKHEAKSDSIPAINPPQRRHTVQANGATRRRTTQPRVHRPRSHAVDPRYDAILAARQLLGLRSDPEAHDSDVSRLFIELLDYHMVTIGRRRRGNTPMSDGSIQSNTSSMRRNLRTLSRILTHQVSNDTETMMSQVATGIACGRPSWIGVRRWFRRARDSILGRAGPSRARGNSCLTISR